MLFWVRLGEKDEAGEADLATEVLEVVAGAGVASAVKVGILRIGLTSEGVP